MSSIMSGLSVVSWSVNAGSSLKENMRRKNVDNVYCGKWREKNSLKKRNGIL